jgi:hypothetical protein
MSLELTSAFWESEHKVKQWKEDKKNMGKKEEEEKKFKCFEKEAYNGSSYILLSSLYCCNRDIFHHSVSVSERPSR